MDVSLRGPPNPGLRFFMVREGGLSMLYDLLLHQAPAAIEERLLTVAPFSRARLAGRFNLSRTHVRRLFAEAADAGHVSFQTRDRVTFAPSIADEAARHFALTFYVVGSSAKSAMDTLARPRASAQIS
jgi:DNA-binding transcriptional regulator LsrR (DeoR family)